MESSDKKALLGVVATLVVVCFSIICIKGTKYLPLGWIAIIVVLCEFFVAALICKKVSWIAGESNPLWPIPIYSSISIFQKHFIVATLISLGLTLITTFLLVANINPFGLTTIGLMFPRYLGVAECILVTVTSIIIGAGYFDVLRQINQLLHKYNRGLKAAWINIIFLCIPLVRVVGLIQIYNASSSLMLAIGKNDISSDDYDYVESEQ